MSNGTHMGQMTSTNDSHRSLGISCFVDELKLTQYCNANCSLKFLLGLVTMRLRGVFLDFLKTLNEAEYSVYPGAASRKDRMLVVKVYYKIVSIL